MYDRTWARSVYDKYAKLCTRAQQINLCILQNAAELYGSNMRLVDLVQILTDSIQGKSNKKLWPTYKRLCKKTPLAMDLLLCVSYQAQKQYSPDPYQPGLFDDVT